MYHQNYVKYFNTHKSNASVTIRQAQGLIMMHCLFIWPVPIASLCLF